MAASAPRVTIGPYVVGEKPPPLVYTFLDSAGAPIDLTGYAVRFTYRHVDGTATEAAAAVTDAAGGKITYTWTGPEIATPGDHWAEIWAGNTANRFCSLRLEYNVRAAVGAVPAI